MRSVFFRDAADGGRAAYVLSGGTRRRPIQHRRVALDGRESVSALHRAPTKCSPAGENARKVLCFKIEQKCRRTVSSKVYKR